MKLASAWLSLMLLVLAGCAGTTTSSTAPPRSQSTPTPTAGVTTTPTTPLPTTPTPPTTTPTPATPPGTSPLAPTPVTNPTPTAPTTSVGTPTTTSTLPALPGTWNVTLISTTGTPSLAFTVTLQQATSGAITGSALTFSRTSACFGTNTSVTGSVSANTLTLVLTSAQANGSNNVVQVELTSAATSPGVSTTSAVLSGTYLVTPATGNPGCGVEAGSATMVRM